MKKISARLASAGLTEGDREMELTVKWRDYGGRRIVRFAFQLEDIKMLRSVLNSEWSGSGTKANESPPS